MWYNNLNIKIFLSFKFRVIILNKLFNVYLRVFGVFFIIYSFNCVSRFLRKLNIKEKVFNSKENVRSKVYFSYKRFCNF